MPMRGRWIKPEFFRDRKIGALGSTAALVFQALWIIADDGGTAKCDADLVKGDMFFLWPSVTTKDIEDALDALEQTERIRRYRVGDETYARIAHFRKHQKVHKPSKFRYPQIGQSIDAGSAALVPNRSGTPHHLDTYTPRHLDTKAGGDGVVPVDYTTSCTIALNKGLARNPHLRGTAREVSASSQVGRVTWEQDSIPLDVATLVVERLAAEFVPNGSRNRQPHSLKYCDGAVREEWDRIRARGITSAADVPGAKDARDAARLRAMGY